MSLDANAQRFIQKRRKPDLDVDLPIEAHNLRLLVTHVEPMSDPSNDLRGERYGIRFDVNGRHRIGFDLGAWRFHQSGNPAVSYSRRTWVLHVGERW